MLSKHHLIEFWTSMQQPIQTYLTTTKYVLKHIEEFYKKRRKCLLLFFLTALTWSIMRQNCNHCMWRKLLVVACSCVFLSDDNIKLLFMADSGFWDTHFHNRKVWTSMRKSFKLYKKNHIQTAGYIVSENMFADRIMLGYQSSIFNHQLMMTCWILNNFLIFFVVLDISTVKMWQTSFLHFFLCIGNQICSAFSSQSYLVWWWKWKSHTIRINDIIYI